MSARMRVLGLGRPSTTVLIILVVLATILGWGGLPPASATVATISNDAARTGWDRNEAGLSPADITSSDFGVVFNHQVDGQVYGQPLVVGSTVIAVTENNAVYGLDPVTGAEKWSRNVGKAWSPSPLSCGDLTPTIGITSTPVYDAATGFVYFLAKVDDGPDVQHPSWWMHAITPGTGVERTGWPVRISGAASNDSTAVFNPEVEMQRPGLLALGGSIYAAFGAHCDRGAYRGFVVGVSTSSPQVSSMWTTEAGSSSSGAGIWQSGGGLVSDGSGRILFSTGNGVMPPVSSGTSVPKTLSESVVRLNATSNGLQAADFFSPSNAATLDSGDQDLGSGGPIALPDSFGTTGHPHVLVQQGKDGRVFLLDRDALGGRSQGSGGTDAVLGVVGPYQGQWGHPAAWSSTAGNYLYLVGNGGPLRALRGGSSSGVPALTQVGASQDTFPYTSGSPVITSNSTDSGSGVVWVMRSGGGSSGTTAQLRAYSAIPDSRGILTLLYSADIGTMAKFTVPATDGNHVYIGTRDGRVIGFGRPATSALTGSPVNFGNVAAGTTATGTLTLTATRSLTVTGATTAAPFGVTAPAQPVSLAAGGTIQLPVSFSPTAAGAASGLVSVTIDAGNVLTFALNGTGTAVGLQAQPATATFVDQVVGSTGLANVQVTNTGSNPEVISAVTGPSGPFTVTGLPSVGTSIPGGGSGSFVLGVKYSPTVAGSDASAVTITSTSGTLKIPLSGTAISGAAHLVLNPSTLDFGSVPVGSSRTLNFDVTNTGNIATTITLAKAPAGVFSTSSPLSEGVVVGPGQVIHQPVTFTPTTVGSAPPAVYAINSDSNTAIMNEQLTGVGTGPVPAPATNSWQLNGTTTMPTAGQLQLTPATNSATGTAFYNTVAPVTGAGTVPTEGLDAKFNVTMNGGSGADGVSFAMLDPSKTAPNAVGGGGGGVGVSGLPGIAVMLQTWPAAGVSSNNFVGVAQTTSSGVTMLKWVNAPSDLRTGSHPVEVSVVSGHVKVSVDGHALLDVVPPSGSLTPSAMIGFTGATGGLNDIHAVNKVTITTQVSGAGTVPVPGPAFGTWQLNGTSTLPSAGQLQLTPAVNGATGTAFYIGAPVSGAVRTEGLDAKFSATMNGGSGADGLSFAMLDPSKSSPTAVGGGGGGVGVSGLPGIAVMLQTYPAAGVSSNNYVGVAQTTPSGVTMLKWVNAPRICAVAAIRSR
ncbi:choice-of-anchor D domain-containing protein [Raineyella fluvialis]|uniref:Choice-of-anchor D domain-containing protein n=1 Tax=Raineyella fluvialis TaxID=2662261 RepID=A0A5Q2FAP3_9ACTN|nr:choice-of-anchor D domain-containing protein [Raineyella fluvialis]QGF23869.1 choice-of-anchor D domain-containing protein [Raineyella fluvialis]